jgi:hypothetical protein
MGSSIGPSMCANSGNYNYYSEFSYISLNGFMNENYFSINQQEKTLVHNLELSHAITMNPFTYKKDAFLGLILKSKYDGVGKREPIDLSIALDISGSMFCTEEYETKTRLDLAKEALTKLVSIMDDSNDRMSLITFNERTQKIFELSNKAEIQNNQLHKLTSIKAGGGTNLLEAGKAALDNLNLNKESSGNRKRLVFITDAYYEDTSEELFNYIKYNAEELKIPCTIIAISSESNVALADKLSHFPGCNYFTVIKSTDLENYLVNNFNYIFFPIAYELKMKIKSDNAKIIKCIGDQNTILDEFDKNKNAVIENKVEFDFGTSFSSDMLFLKDKAYSKGGYILLKISPDDINKNEDIKFDLCLEYVSDDNNFKSCQTYSYIIKNEEKNINEFYKDNNIKKAISIYYFVNALNWLVLSEKEKKNNKNEKPQTPNRITKEEDMKMLETRQVIQNNLENNFGNEPDIEENRKLLNNYLNLLNKRYQGFRAVVITFYNLQAAPPAF